MLFRNDPLDKKRLLTELDSMGYSDRMKRIAVLGREYKGEATYSALLASLLDSGSAYEGHLALTGASVANDPSAVLLGLNHGKAGVRGRAARLLPEVVSEPDFLIESEIVFMSYESRRQLFRSIVTVSRQDWAERLLPLVLSRWGGIEAAKLLSACREETVRHRLPELGYAVRNWKLLTNRNPVIVADYFNHVLQSATQQEKIPIWWRFASAIEILSVSRPNFVLECALKYGPSDVLHPVLKPRLGILMNADPNGVFRLLTREEARGDLLTHGVPTGVLKCRKLFSVEQWAELTSLLADQPLHVAKVLDTLAPSWRGSIFEAAYKEEGRGMRIFPMQLLDALPHLLRDKEASRMLGLRGIVESRNRVLEITARRLIDHAREKLEQAAYGSSGADERAAAYIHLVKSTALSRTGMNETLRFLTRIKNDQDPVRSAVMNELSSCPITIFTDDHADDLTLLADSVIEARDTSYATRMSTENLVFALIRYHASQPESALFKLALRTFTRMAMRDGQFMLRSMNWDSLPDRALTRLADELYALGVEANKRESFTYILRMAGTFGKAAERLPKLQLLLKELLQDKSVSPQAVHYWLAPRKTRDERVKELLARDPSFISFQEVFMHLHLKRQEWLDPFISGAVIKGKHLSGKTIYVVPSVDGFHRWLPRQQKKLALLMEKVALDTKRNFRERSTAMRGLAKMPDYSSNQWTKLLKDEEVQIVESALQACSFWEEPEKALPVLLDHLDGDRARVAMYAIPRCVRKMKPESMTAMLADLLNRDKLRITVRKEAIRLLGAYKSSESLSLLLREFGKPNAHKDVLIAIGHAARQWLDDERSWDILGSLALSPERDIVKSLLYQKPDELPLKDRPRYVQWIAEIAGRVDPDVAKEAFRAMSFWAKGNEELLAESACKAIMDSENSSRWKAALDTLIVSCRDGLVNEQVIGLCRQLADTESSAQWNASAERDLPHRQRLFALIDKLVLLPQYARRELVPLYDGFIGVLSVCEAMQPVLIKLHLAKIEWNNIDQAVTCLDHVIQLGTAQPYLLDYAYRMVIQTVHAGKGNWTPEALLTIVECLDARAQFEAQYVGLSLLQAAGKSLMWNQASAERLRTYRKHWHEAIRILALDMWTSLE
ncbi:HEAT repeat domain-containing protein [Paenibacillus sp. HWE-109]|uniref:HEAT repeat domain-containing protein n=1 Tax=Paenibacillus sp. HWE-109 TaxID=1306526 RepID=UPI001EDD1CA3|nr:HEAT repeat domain-containing protein [Paenibacillus sp. HWE-109]UKS26600.1 HEAT repeat domain-containing protein [Paenibacillus sp. HWE-109]